MTVSADNKRFFVTISKVEYAQLEKIAKANTRSVSKQVLHFIRQGMNSEEKRG